MGIMVESPEKAARKAQETGHAVQKKQDEDEAKKADDRVARKLQYPDDSDEKQKRSTREDGSDTSIDTVKEKTVHKLLNLTPLLISGL